MSYALGKALQNKYIHPNNYTIANKKRLAGIAAQDQPL